MKQFSRLQLLLGALAPAGLLVLIVILFMQASDIGGGNRPRTGPSSRGSSQHAPIRTEVMPTGIERSLTVDIPLIGRMRGTHWIAGHKFQALKEEDNPTGELADRGLDVLVDSDGIFIAARFNGERFATRPPEESFKNLLRHVRYFGLLSAESGLPTVPRIANVEPARLPWDDPDLGDCIRKLINRSYVWHKEDALTRYEEIYFAVNVWFTGEATPRNIVVRRYTDGLAEGGAPFPQNAEKWDVGDAIRNSNRYGASVITQAWEVGSPLDTRGRKPLMYLTEPWAGPCPWPLDKLDPYYGDNRLNEFLMPAELGTDFMPDLSHWTPHEKPPADYFREQAEKNKAARLAQEAGGNARPGR